jgi:hypothetical protein
MDKHISIETIHLQLARLLKKCHMNTAVCDSTNATDTLYYIPNNDNKYIVYVTRDASKHCILLSFVHVCLVSSATKSSTTPTRFFVELDDVSCPLKNFEESVFEGYLYESGSTEVPYDFYISDIIIKCGDVVEDAYDMRYFTLYDLVYEYDPDHSFVMDKLLNLDISINLRLPQVLSSKQNLSLFCANHAHSSRVSHVEVVYGMFDKRNEKVAVEKQSQRVMIIEKGQQSEIYNVFDTFKRNKCGILYIQNVSISKYLEALFCQTTNGELKHICSWNARFEKWQLVA